MIYFYVVTAAAARSVGFSRMDRHDEAGNAFGGPPPFSLSLSHTHTHIRIQTHARTQRRRLVPPRRRRAVP
jgi:hypothetical protein